MDLTSHYKAVSAEFLALERRVRNLIGGAHYLTDGEWKESVLRAFIARHVPAHVHVGRGFVVTGGLCSTQIDVLLYDSRFPLLYREGDLVFATPDAVLGIIEVKTSADGRTLPKTLRKLADNAALVHQGPRNPRRRLVTGVFAYGAPTEPRRKESSVEAAYRAAGMRRERAVSLMALGPSWFVRYWERDPGGGQQAYDRWHLYRTRELAFGYFLHNVIGAVAPASVRNNRPVWYPNESKELSSVLDVSLATGEVRRHRH
jgi:hypothetical protein